MDSDWEAPPKLRALQEAILNYAAVSQSLWPMDFTPAVISRVLVVNNWGAAAGPDTARSALVATFFDWLMVENAANAAKSRPPADYRRAKEIWERALETVGPAERNHGRHEGGNHGRHDGGNHDKKRPPRPPGGVGPTAQPQVGGMYVCYRFNEAVGCQRQKQGQGCRVGSGQVFVHACSAVKADGSWCLAGHSKTQHK